MCKQEMERDKMNKDKTITKLFVCLLIVISLIGSVGCYNGSSNKNEPPIVVINNTNVSKEEMILYILQIKSEFEQLGGQDVWSIEDFSGGKTAIEVARQGALENLIKVKLLVDNSQDISLSQEQKEKTIRNAKLYYNKINKNYIQQYNIKEDTVINTFLESQISNEVANNIINNYNPTEKEISDKMMTNEDYAKLVGKNPKDVLTKIIVKHIVTKTHNKSKSGELIPLDDKTQNRAKVKINEAYKKAIRGYNFDNLIDQYSEDDQLGTNNGIYEFSKALMTKEYKDALDKVPLRGVSAIVTSGYGYHIFKVIGKTSPTDKDVLEYKNNFIKWKETLKKEYENLLRKEAFNEFYEEIKINAKIEIDEIEWAKINIK
jgi:parvulin-like peptidyl-prolyl isomerase